MDQRADQAVEEVVRTSYGRLVALLAMRTRDLEAAEDALADALLAALRTWPERGIPASPEAWMLTAARRSLIGAHRRGDTARRALPTLAVLADELEQRTAEGFPDRRLELLFACTHPALAPEVRAPLMLQAVLGLDGARIADAFLVKPATMSQQLVRAKRRIAASGIPYRVPEPSERPERVGFVLDAIYAAYTTGWDDLGPGTARHDLAAEALHLARATAELLPDQAEAHGLAALLLHTDARAGARRDPSGRFVPLPNQDVAQWSRPAMELAEAHLTRALALGSVGPYQLQAAIQSVHNRRALTGTTDWAAISTLHDGLQQLAPSVGGAVARAAAHLHAGRPDVAQSVLAAVEPDAERYQPYWVTVAEVAATSADLDHARRALDRALDLTADPGVADHLRRRRRELRPPGAP